MKICGRDTSGFAVGIHNIEHKAKHKNTDDRTDPYHDHVNVISRLANFGNSSGHIKLPRRALCANASRE